MLFFRIVKFGLTLDLAESNYYVNWRVSVQRGVALTRGLLISNPPTNFQKI